MAQKVKCPNCKKLTDCQKKGVNSKGDQRYLCKECNKTFVDGAGSVNVVSVGKAKTKKIEVAGNVKTKIMVNSVEVKTVSGKLTEDEAFNMISDYFREVSKTNVEKKSETGLTTYHFKIETGRKG